MPLKGHVRGCYARVDIAFFAENRREWLTGVDAMDISVGTTQQPLSHCRIRTFTAFRCY